MDAKNDVHVFELLPPVDRAEEDELLAHSQIPRGWIGVWDDAWDDSLASILDEAEAEYHRLDVRAGHTFELYAQREDEHGAVVEYESRVIIVGKLASD